MGGLPSPAKQPHAQRVLSLGVDVPWSRRGKGEGDATCLTLPRPARVGSVCGRSAWTRRIGAWTCDCSGQSPASYGPYPNGQGGHKQSSAIATATTWDLQSRHTCRRVQHDGRCPPIATAPAMPLVARSFNRIAKWTQVWRLEPLASFALPRSHQPPVATTFIADHGYQPDVAPPPRRATCHADTAIVLLSRRDNSSFLTHNMTTASTTGRGNGGREHGHVATTAVVTLPFDPDPHPPPLPPTSGAPPPLLSNTPTRRGCNVRGWRHWPAVTPRSNPPRI